MISLRLSEVEYEVLKTHYRTYGARNVSELARLALQRIMTGAAGSPEGLAAKLAELDDRVHALESQCLVPVGAGKGIAMRSPHRIFRYLLAALALACAGAQQPAASTAPPASGYVLGPDDQILIRALEGLDLGDKPVLIGTNGNITLPLIGRVKAAGLTVEQLEAELATRLKVYVQEPQISVTVTEFRSQPVSVSRRRHHPRHRPAPRPQNPLRGPLHGRRTARNRRFHRLHHPPPGKRPHPPARRRPRSHRPFSTAELDMQQILDGKNPAANIEIKPHDVISVSQGNARMVYVVGDVQRSGAFNLGGQRTISVLSAVSLAGGLGRTAKPEQAQVFRPLPDGQKHQEIAVNIKQILAGKAEDIGSAPRRRPGGPHQQPQNLRRSCLRDPGRRRKRRHLRGSSRTLTSTLMSDQPLLDDPGQTPARRHGREPIFRRGRLTWKRRRP